MPRQDVPYGGAICRLRERIAEIFDKLGEKLHTINGVPGDGDGNVKIVSGSSAVVINNDPTQNEIAVSLDTSQLPAASVSSVNGQTGAVALDAGDIPSDGNSDVQSDIDALQTMDGALQGNINAEALARQNADSTLQTNINSANALISGKVSKLTTAGDYAYTHSGSTDGEIAVVDGTTASTIPVRDANGRLQAADPANGATDKTLTTANWISQTGAGRPNNLIHSSGTEERTGELRAVGGNNDTCFTIKATNIDQTTPASRNSPLMRFYDKNDVWLAYLYVHQNSNGTTDLIAWVRNSDGSSKSVTLAAGNVI